MAAAARSRSRDRIRSRSRTAARPTPTAPAPTGSPTGPRLIAGYDLLLLIGVHDLLARQGVALRPQGVPAARPCWSPDRACRPSGRCLRPTGRCLSPAGRWAGADGGAQRLPAGVRSGVRADVEKVCFEYAKNIFSAFFPQHFRTPDPAPPQRMSSSADNRDRPRRESARMTASALGWRVSQVGLAGVESESESEKKAARGMRAAVGGMEKRRDNRWIIGTHYRIKTRSIAARTVRSAYSRAPASSGRLPRLRAAAERTEIIASIFAPARI